MTTMLTTMKHTIITTITTIIIPSAFAGSTILRLASGIIHLTSWTITITILFIRLIVPE